MGKPETKRKYNMPDADLSQKSSLLHANITRDMADFTARGMTAPRLATLPAARTTFDNFPTDVELQGLVTVPTEVKAGMRFEIEKQVRRVRGMADEVYHGNGLYKTFGFDDLTHQPDNELYRLVKRVVRVGTSLIDDFSDQGLTVAELTALGLLNEQFSEQIELVSEAIETRDIQTQKRIQYGNALFDIVMEFAKMGKNIYQDTDEAKYNDYMINDPKHVEVPEAPVAA